MLSKAPGFTVVAVLTLALGIGANTALFSVIHSVLFSPLPFLHSDRLAYLESYWNPEDYGASSGPDYLDWAERNTVFDGLCAMSSRQPNLTGGGDPLALEGLEVSANFFDVVEPRMTLGRDFLPEEAQTGAPGVAILSPALWRSRFGADPGIIGKVIVLDDVPHTVVGVSSQRMGFLEKKAQVYVPFQRDRLMQQRTEHYLIVLGRRKADVTWEQAGEEMVYIAGQLETQYPENKHKSVRIHPLHEFLVSRLRTTLLILYGAVTVLLAIACVNVSNLLLARAATRGRELAIRRSLGAGRWRITRQLLTESLLLGLAGGVLGLLLAHDGLAFVQKAASQIDLPGGVGIPGSEQMRVNRPVLGFTLLLSLAAGLFFGTIPAWHVSGRGLSATLKEGAQAASGGRSRHRTMGTLVVVQIALALVLLTGAGLLSRSYLRLQESNPGFNTDGLLALRMVRPDTPANRPVESRAAFYQRVTDQLASLPQVKAVGGASLRPISRENSNTSIRIQGAESAADREKPWAEVRFVTRDYFACLQIPLCEGRGFTAEDTRDSQRVIVVNEEFVRRYFPGRDPIGQRVGLDGADRTIVGVVGNVKLRSLRADVFDPLIYQPMAQRCGRGMTLFIRATGDPLQWADAARRVIWDIDPSQPILEVQTMNHLIAGSISIERSCTVLLAIMAGLALAVGLVGLYAVMSSAVNERRNEIGIRMALGAERRDILRLTLKKGLILTVVGLVVGLGMTLVVSRLLANLLYGVSVYDPATFVLVPLLLFVVAAVAAWLPARRAARVDPMVALRCE
jgi:putative ABC transport system permease protein